MAENPGIPQHVAVIMDGNGRWAKARKMVRLAGHRAGARAARHCIEAAVKYKVKWLTLYAFSSENWRRSESEVKGLKELLRYYLRREVPDLVKNGVKFHIIGEKERFGPAITEEIRQAEELTKNGQALNLVMALSYGGRNEILSAARKAGAAIADKTLQPEALTEERFNQFLFTAGIPDPDLFIRTGGERRLSNFLLWQCAYTELFFTDVLWPDFTEKHFSEALAEYSRRERRYGARPGESES